jgi:hypothetical protein
MLEKERSEERNISVWLYALTKPKLSLLAEFESYLAKK